MDLSCDDPMCTADALDELLHGPDAVEEREFHTPLGAGRDDARALHRRVLRELDHP